MLAPMNAPALSPLSGYEAQANFVCELASRLHAYGTTAQRLEGAVEGVAHRLGLDCEVWSNPTGIILSFADPVRGQHNGITRVLRLAPGEQNLDRLVATDFIAEEVLAGRQDPADGLVALKALDLPSSRREQAMSALSFGLSGAAVAALLGGGWPDIATAGVIGIVIGVMSVMAAERPRLAEALEALAALVATLAAAAVASFVAPLSLQTVIVASLIVLMPGLTLTNAINELASQQLVSGTARFAGAVVVLMKLTFGTVAAMQIVALLGWSPQEAKVLPLSLYSELAALCVSAFAFAVLFHAARRDYLLVMVAVVFGYGVTRGVGQLLELSSVGFAGGTFFGGLAIAAASNAYGRWANRPGALIRVPGIILLVPGSVGFRSLSSVMGGDMSLGLDTAMVLLSALIALVAGLLFGNLLVPSRRNI